jgi:hypothetical protein
VPQKYFEAAVLESFSDNAASIPSLYEANSRRGAPLQETIIALFASARRAAH